MYRIALALGTAAATIALFVVTLSVDQARAGNHKQRPDVIHIDLIGRGPGGGATGQVLVVNNAEGPDQLNLSIDGLPPDERITIFLTRHQDPSKLPAQFIGEFTTNARGHGTLSLRAEIGDAFASANQELEDEFGEADVFGAGTLPVPRGGTANTIPLNWFRGYFVDQIDGIPPHNVFGPNEDTAGGAIAFISDPALP